MRFEKAADLLRLAYRLQGSGEGLSLRDIQEQFGISRRTAERMRDAVGQVFPELESHEDSDRMRRWRLRSSVALGRLDRVTVDELAALEAGMQALRAINRAAEATRLRDLSDRIQARLEPGRRRKFEPDLEALTEAEGLAMRPGPRPRLDQAALSCIRNAILARRRIRIRYKRTGAAGWRWHKVCPYGLLYGARPYLVAYSLSPQVLDYRLFRLSNVEAVEVLDEPFTYRDDFSLQDYAKRSFGVFQEPPIDVVWRFKPEAADEAREWVFHPDQVVEDQPDGSLLVRFRAGGRQEMDWHLYTWGDAVEDLTVPPASAAAGDAPRQFPAG